MAGNFHYTKVKDLNRLLYDRQAKTSSLSRTNTSSSPNIIYCDGHTKIPGGVQRVRCSQEVAETLQEKEKALVTNLKTMQMSPADGTLYSRFQAGLFPFEFSQLACVPETLGLRAHKKQKGIALLSADDADAGPP